MVEGSNSADAPKTREADDSASSVRGSSAHGERGEFVGVAHPHEQPVVVVPAQAGEGRRQRGLTQAETLGGLAHAALVEQGVERGQEAKVGAGHRTNIGRSDGGHRQIRLP